MIYQAYRPEKSVSVRFGGQISESWENGELRITHTEYDEVKAIPFDLMIVAGVAAYRTTGSRMRRVALREKDNA